VISVKNRKFFPYPTYLTPLMKGFPLEIRYQHSESKNQNDRAPGPIKKSDDIFSHLDTMYQCDRRTDRGTQDDSEYHTYAYRCAVISQILGGYFLIHLVHAFATAPLVKKLQVAGTTLSREE